MSSNSSLGTGNNLLSGSPHSLSWVVQGSSWKSGSKLPVGWFLMNWLAHDNASAHHARRRQVAIERRISTEAGQDYVLQVEIPDGIPSGSSLQLQWGDQTLASLGGGLKAGQSLSVALEGHGDTRALRLITDSDVDLGALRGFGLWAVPSGRPTALAMNTHARVGQTLFANTRSITDIDGLGAYSFQWQQLNEATGQWCNVADATNEGLKLSKELAGSQLPNKTNIWKEARPVF